MIVTRYGVHWAQGGIAFLHQGKAATHALPVSLSSPFDVRANGRCPHEIDITSTVAMPAELDDPLTRVMLPLPVSPAGPRAWMCEPNEAIEPLRTLSTPTDQQRWPIWWEAAKMKAQRFRLTDITPLIFDIVTIDHVDRMQRVMELAEQSSRRVLFVTHVRVPMPRDVERFETKLTSSVAMLPLAQIGAGALREYMLTKKVPI